MICPKCKNPIEDNATVCEWCGVDFTVFKNENNVEEFSDLDAKIILLLKQGQKSQALELYKERTGANGRYHVARLNFFLQHEQATENIWRNYARKSTTKYILIKIVQGFLLFVALLTGVGNSYDVIENSHEFMGLGRPAVFICIIICIIVAFLIIYWIYRTRKLKI